MTGYTLDPATVVGYLAERHVLPAGASTVEVLSGGVSNDVLAVSAGGVEVVVKQALPRLRVAEEWLATPLRIGREARAIELAGSVCPGAVPAVLHLDDASHVLVMTRAAQQARTWKGDLLAGRVDLAVAARVGELAGRWHEATLLDPSVAGAFGDLEPFVQLRVDPYHRTVARRHPDLAGRVEAIAGELLSDERRCCLVHGDLSPKNVLVDVAVDVDVGVAGPGVAGAAGPSAAGVPPVAGPGTDPAGGTGPHGGDMPADVWVIDWEVAHFGNPVFDLGFVLCHLACKIVHRPADAGRLAAAARRFLAAHAEQAPAVAARLAPSDLAVHTACLMLARVDGKSPVEYLDEPGRDRLRQLACRVLRSAAPDLDAIFTPQQQARPA